MPLRQYSTQKDEQPDQRIGWRRKEMGGREASLLFHASLRLGSQSTQLTRTVCKYGPNIVIKRHTSCLDSLDVAKWKPATCSCATVLIAHTWTSRSWSVSWLRKSRSDLTKEEWSTEHLRSMQVIVSKTPHHCVLMSIRMRHSSCSPSTTCEDYWGVDQWTQNDINRRFQPNNLSRCQN